jgi:hypothetical protein
VTCTMSCSQVLMPRPCTASYAARFREIILVAFRTKVAKCNARPKGELEALVMPGSDEVTSKLHLLPRQAAGEVEMGIDECDSQRQPWAGGSLTLLRLGHKISQDGKWESIATIQ